MSGWGNAAPPKPPSTSSASPGMAVRPADAKILIKRYEDNPVLYASEVLGHSVWHTPAAVLKALTKQQAMVAVKSCHASGKTFTAAESVLWWVCTGGVAITTAPTANQVERVLWGEIRAMHARARLPIGGRLNLTELHLGPKNYAIGFSTDLGVRFQGFHGRILIVLDEAVGIRPDIWEAIDGIQAGGDVRLLALGNPTVPAGPFYDAFGARSTWDKFTIDGFDTPNLKGYDEDTILHATEQELNTNHRPYLMTRRWMRDKLLKWGRTSPLWLARGRGQFPAQSEDSLIGLVWIEQARHNKAPAPVRHNDPADWWAGLDVAGPGDNETVLTIRRGKTVMKQLSWAEADPRHHVVEVLTTYKQRGIQVNVDAVGSGYYFARHLEDCGFIVHDIDVSELPTDTDEVKAEGKLTKRYGPGVDTDPGHPTYKNQKAEFYWNLRELFRNQEIDLSRLPDVEYEDLAAELATLQYLENNGKLEIVPKKDMRKRGIDSPDRAESLMLCFACGKEAAIPWVPGFAVGSHWLDD